MYKVFNGQSSVFGLMDGTVTRHRHTIYKINGMNDSFHSANMRGGNEVLLSIPKVSADKAVCYGRGQLSGGNGFTGLSPYAAKESSVAAVRFTGRDALDPRRSW